MLSVLRFYGLLITPVPNCILTLIIILTANVSLNRYAGGGLARHSIVTLFHTVLFSIPQGTAGAPWVWFRFKVMPMLFSAVSSGAAYLDIVRDSSTHSWVRVELCSLSAASWTETGNPQWTIFFFFPTVRYWAGFVVVVILLYSSYDVENNCLVTIGRKIA